MTLAGNSRSQKTLAEEQKEGRWEGREPWEMQEEKEATWLAFKGEDLRRRMEGSCSEGKSRFHFRRRLALGEKGLSRELPRRGKRRRRPERRRWDREAIFSKEALQIPAESPGTLRVHK